MSRTFAKFSWPQSLVSVTRGREPSERARLRFGGCRELTHAGDERFLIGQRIRPAS